MMVKHIGNLVRAFGGVGALRLFAMLLMGRLILEFCYVQEFVLLVVQLLRICYGDANGGCALASSRAVWPYGSSF